MKIYCRTILKLAASIGLAVGASSVATAQKPAVPKGFTALFDGKTLKGWRGDTSLFKVEDGAITVGSRDRIPFNTYLIHDKPYGNFEVRYKYRWLTEEGNSGFQFRSAQAEGHFALTGLQANVVPLGEATTRGRPERYGMLYNELGDRQEMVLLGQKATITRRTATGGGTARVVRTVHEMVNSRDDILANIRKAPEWNEVVLIAYGNHIVSAINGMLAFDALDNDPVGHLTGRFGLQAHSGPSMVVQYKDIFVKPLKSEPNLAGRFKSNPHPAPEPTKTYKDSTRAGLKDVALPE
jgi:hypothetical protein